MKRLLFVTSVFAMAATIQAADPFAGTWKLNLSKSTGPNQPKELTVVLTEKGDQIDSVVKGIGENGQPIATRSTVPLKGGAVKFLEGGPPAGTTVIQKVVDPLTRENTTTRDGKVVSTIRFVVSKEGKSMSVTGNGVNPQGKPVKIASVMDKQ